MNKTIHIVSIGTDGSSTLTAEANKAIKSADVLIGAERMVKAFADLDKPAFVSYDSTAINEYIRSCGYERIVVLMSGDCGFYSGAEKLCGLLSDMDVDVLAGVSSPVYLCAKLKLPWQDVRFVSLHGRSSSVARQAASNRRVFFLLGGSMTAADVCRRLCDYGLGHITVHIGEDLSLPTEHIISGRADELTEHSGSKLAVMLTENEAYERYIPVGIPDSSFERGAVPMTKSEVRALCISKLNIAANSICWDIGCGTGSCTVEMALRCPDGMVYACDKKEEAICLTEKNCHNLHCDNVMIASGDAAEKAAEFPAPDCVMIGGSGGQLSSVLLSLAACGKPVRTVITAVSLETLNIAAELMEELGTDVDIVQIAVTRTRKLGTHTMFDAQNPIFIISGVIGGQA